MIDSLIVIGPLLLLALWLGLKNWRKALAVSLVLLIFEGALRKWFFPGSERLLYFAKDIFFLGAFAGFLAKVGLRIPVRHARIVLALVGLAAAYGAFQIANPSLPNLTLGIIGWKSYFLYVPFIVMVPYALISDEQLQISLRKYLLLAVPIAALAIVQTYSGSDSFLNTFVRGGLDADIARYGEELSYVRATGTFSYITGYSTYAITMMLLALGLLSARGWQWKDNKGLYLALTASLIAGVTTGSRAPIFSIAIVFPFFLLWGLTIGGLKGGTLARLTIGITLVCAAVWFGMEDPVTAYRYRAVGSQDTLSRLVGPFVEPFTEMDKLDVFGFGIGAMHQSGSVLTGSDFPWWTREIMYESESTKVLAEVGPVGFLLVYAVRIVLLFQAIRFAYRLSDKSKRSLAAVIAMFFALSLPGAVIFNPTANMFYWFSAGLLYYLARSDQRNLSMARNANASAWRRQAPPYSRFAGKAGSR